MSCRTVSITLDNLDDLPRRCRQCVFWELDPVSEQRAREVGQAALEKEAWVSATLLDWGSCGRLAYVDAVPAGFVMFAPPAYVPRSAAFATGPVSADAVLLMTGHVRPEFTGRGVGRLLIQHLARDLMRHGVRAIEAFGHSDGTGSGCLLPAEYLLSVGFTTVRPHPRHPRLRLDLRSTVTWREDVEYAMERLLGSISREPALRPV